MDPNSTGFSDFVNGSEFNNESLVSDFSQFPVMELGSKFTVPSPDLSFSDMSFVLPDHHPDPGISTPSTLSPDFEYFVDSTSLSPDGSSFPTSTGWSTEGQASSPSDDSDSSDPVLKYISQMLMEESMEEKPSMRYDPFDLQATEKSLYDVLGGQQPQYPLSFDQPELYVNLNSDSLEASNYFSNGTGDVNGSSATGARSSSGGNSFSVDKLVVGDAGEYNTSMLQTALPSEYYLKYNLQQPSTQFSAKPPESVTNVNQGLMSSSVNELLAQNIFSDTESILQFQRGLEEASKFLPTGNQLIIDLESYGFSKEQKGENSKVEEGEREKSPEGSRGQKNHEREDGDLEEQRSNKQSAVSLEESEISEMFDKVLLIRTDEKGAPIMCSKEDCCDDLQTGSNSNLQQNEQSNGSNGGRSRARRQGKKKETVDLRTLLILCAQAVATNDFRTANELLKQIRQHSSPFGDGSQRLAHYFANGLEARLAGSGTGIKNFFTSYAPKQTAADILKAYKVYLSACPFKKFAIFFAIQNIMNVAENAKTLHIVDFGIQYGFQWPVLIQFLSMRAGGPPKLHLTGIELPQPGFRPAERIEETGRRLAKYCERFNVPFEYNGIPSQNWETIKIQDLKIGPNEMLAVNCLYRFERLLDETAEVNCPRDAVLNLIREMKPAIFVNSICNGSYNTPFFVMRFREAIFHFSSLFDMFDTTIPRENQERMFFEREFYGRDAINTIACEGLERFGRPETYKPWQTRIMRAGFKPYPLDQELMKKLTVKLETWYDKNFVLYQDSCWMLQGWKGRILYASSGWVPA